MIPVEAVEAANKAVYRNFKGLIRPLLVKVALEAAAPHMTRTVTTADELDALPVHSIVSEAIGYAWQKVESRQWVSWLNPGEDSGWLASGRRGPFTVLRVGGAE